MDLFFSREGRAGLAPRRCEVVCLLGDRFVWSPPQHVLSARKEKKLQQPFAIPTNPCMRDARM